MLPVQWPARTARQQSGRLITLMHAPLCFHALPLRPGLTVCPPSQPAFSTGLGWRGVPCGRVSGLTSPAGGDNTTNPSLTTFGACLGQCDCVHVFVTLTHRAGFVPESPWPPHIKTSVAAFFGVPLCVV